MKHFFRNLVTISMWIFMGIGIFFVAVIIGTCALTIIYPM